MRIDWSKQPLGKLSDSEIAERLGMSWTTVAKARISRGITTAALRQRREYWDRQPLGEDTDVNIAKDLGVAPPTVRKNRVARGISAFKKN